MRMALAKKTTIEDEGMKKQSQSQFEVEVMK
jgi:hypothetical protein